jgi:Tol biopolymer transport system component
MTERPVEGMTAYEARLGRELFSASDRALRPFDAFAIARAMAAGHPRRRFPLDFSPVPARWLRVLVLLALLVTAIFIGLFAAGNRSTPTPPSLGQLAFVRTPFGPWSPGNSDLYVAEADGTNARVIASSIDGGASWSASGRYLTAENATPLPDITIHILEPDGQEVGVIDAGYNAIYRWSPTRDELAVVSQAATGASIRVYRSDGTLVRRLQTPPGVTAIVNGLDWSPDGARIVVAGCTGCLGKSSATDSDLWIVEPDGTAPTRLTHSPSEIETMPMWAPDGSLIVYSRVLPCVSGACSAPTTWTIRPDGSKATRAPIPGSEAIWSPDGSRLMFTTQVDQPDALDIYAADLDGANNVRLTTERGQDTPIAWGRDGRQILYWHVAPGDAMADKAIELWAMDADGSNHTRLAADSSSAGWQWLP